jgi:uncharacterized membrane protein YfcA
MNGINIAKGFLSLLLGTIGAIVGYSFGGNPGAMIGSGIVIVLSAAALNTLFQSRIYSATDRMIALKRLMDSGLISTSEFDSKRIQILDDL